MPYDENYESGPFCPHWAALGTCVECEQIEAAKLYKQARRYAAVRGSALAWDRARRLQREAAEVSARARRMYDDEQGYE